MRRASSSCIVTHSLTPFPVFKSSGFPANSESHFLPLPLLNFFAVTHRETLEESSLAQAEIARRCGIPAPHLTQLKQGKRRCIPEYDLRLSAFFGITPGRWMNLQLDYEFMRADREKGEAIRKEVQPSAA